MILGKEKKFSNLGDSILNFLNDVMLGFIAYEAYFKFGENLMLAVASCGTMFFIDTFVLALSVPSMTKLSEDKILKELPKHIWKVSIVNMIALAALKFL